MSSIRNPDGTWINTACFREAAEHFKKHGVYTTARPGTIEYLQYWDEETKRCREGYSVGGAKITGPHYAYMNYGQIYLVNDSKEKVSKKVIKRKKKAVKKVISFPDFWDGDYNFFWLMHIAEFGIDPEEYKKLNLNINIREDCLDGGKHVCLSKCRRRGFSYKLAFMAANKYNTERNSTIIVGSCDYQRYTLETMNMVRNYLDFFNEHTAWKKRRQYYDKKDFVEASFKINKDGVTYKKGYKSRVIGVTFKDNANAARGKDASMILFEEAGTFNNLKKSFRATQATVEEGQYVNGIMAIFGTGSLDASGWEDFSEIFYEPDKFNMIAVENQWDENKLGTYSGTHFGSDLNRGGFMDEHGNSDRVAAKAEELDIRETLKANGGTSEDLQSRCSENALCPSEMFRVTGISIFPVAELQKTFSNLIKNKVNNSDFCGSFKFDTAYEKGVKWYPDMNKELTPLTSYKLKRSDNKEGAIVIYEHPPKEIPEDMYIIGVDTLAFGSAANSSSLFSAYVYKTLTRWSGTYNTIVAHYVGRHESLDKLNEILMQLTMYFNATVAFENERGGDSLISYFKGNNPYNINLWHKLIDQPQTLLDATFKKSTIDRGKGIPMMNKSMKKLGEKLVNQLLREERGYMDDGSKLLNLHTYKDKGLVEELLIYDGEKNTDRVSSLMMIAIALEELNLRHKEILSNEAGNPVLNYFSKFAPKKKKNMYGSNRRTPSYLSYFK